MSLAILANNEARVKYLLQNQPATLNERNFFNQTPLHLAVEKPSCLRLLMQSAVVGSALLNKGDSDNFLPVELALYLGGLQCRNGRRRLRCRGCRCAESLTILLKADCAVPVVTQVLLDQTSQRCRLRYSRHMRNRRERLKQLAIENLTPAESRRLGLMSGGVLDHFVPQVLQLLRERSVTIPKAFSIGWLGPSATRSVYQALGDPLDAERFFALGFRDTDVWWEDMVEFRGNGYPLPKPPYLQWLAEHGADVLFHHLTPLESGRGLFTAHYVFWEIGRTLPHFLAHRSRDASLETWIRTLHIALPRLEVVDHCQCRCWSGSCTPLTYLFKGLENDRDHTTFADSCSYMKRIASNLSQYLELFGAYCDVKQHTAAVRFFTFETLRIPHTCCDDPRRVFFDLRNYKLGRCDVEEIEDEHAYELALLEELVGEFEDEITAILQDTDRGIFGVADFWRYRWVDRVREALERLEGDNLSDGEKREAESIGVVWEELALDLWESEDDEEVHYDRRTWDYWVYELEKIERDGRGR